MEANNVGNKKYSGKDFQETKAVGKMKCLALFDLDGTITRNDTLLEFIKFSHGRFGMWKGLAIHSPRLLLMKLRILDNGKVKERVLSWFYKGYSKRQMREKADQFVKLRFESIVNKNALERINFHKKKGDKIYIVSASPDIWVEKIAEVLKVDSVSTRLKFEQDFFTGQFDGLNCYGLEKVNRILEKEKVSEYDEVFAYGDSRGDKELLGIASQQFFKYF
jgi:HAD superfamily hydrolase (TIGR01490 family)